MASRERCSSRISSFVRRATPIYQAVNKVLAEKGFDRFAEKWIQRQIQRLSPVLKQTNTVVLHLHAHLEERAPPCHRLSAGGLALGPLCRLPQRQSENEFFDISCHVFVEGNSSPLILANLV